MSGTPRLAWGEGRDGGAKAGWALIGLGGVMSSEESVCFRSPPELRFGSPVIALRSPFPPPFLLPYMLDTEPVSPFHIELCFWSLGWGEQPGPGGGGGSHRTWTRSSLGCT